VGIPGVRFWGYILATSPQYIHTQTDQKQNQKQTSASTSLYKVICAFQKHTWGPPAVCDLWSVCGGVWPAVWVFCSSSVCASVCFKLWCRLQKNSESKIRLRSSKEGSRYRFKFNNLNILFFMSKVSVQNTVKSRVQSEGSTVKPRGPQGPHPWDGTSREQVQ